MATFRETGLATGSAGSAGALMGAMQSHRIRPNCWTIPPRSTSPKPVSRADLPSRLTGKRGPSILTSTSHPKLPRSRRSRQDGSIAANCMSRRANDATCLRASSPLSRTERRGAGRSRTLHPQGSHGVAERVANRSLLCAPRITLAANRREIVSSGSCSQRDCRDEPARGVPRLGGLGRSARTASRAMVARPGKSVHRFQEPTKLPCFSWVLVIEPCQRRWASGARPFLYWVLIPQQHRVQNDIIGTNPAG